MNDLKFGDICIADLSRSLDYPGRSFTPLVFLETEDADTGTPVYIFCRIGNIAI